MKVLVDMNLSPRWMGVLGDAGFEAAHGSSLGASNASDSQIMDFAQANGYVVVTHDLDFSAILAATQGKMSSVVQIRAERVSPDAIRAAVIAALRQMADELQMGALVTVDPARKRLRVLPLRARYRRFGPCCGREPARWRTGRSPRTDGESQLLPDFHVCAA